VATLTLTLTHTCIRSRSVVSRHQRILASCRSRVIRIMPKKMVVQKRVITSKTTGLTFAVVVHISSSSLPLLRPTHRRNNNSNNSNNGRPDCPYRNA
jgi:hypothetical protein